MNDEGKRLDRIRTMKAFQVQNMTREVESGYIGFS